MFMYDGSKSSRKQISNLLFYLCFNGFNGFLTTAALTSCRVFAAGATPAAIAADSGVAPAIVPASPVREILRDRRPRIQTYLVFRAS